MKRCFWLLAWLVLATLPVQAQRDWPKNEFYIGYSYNRDASGRLGEEVSQGWSITYNYNFAKYVGLTTDFGGEYGKAQELAEAFFGVYPALFGPRFVVPTRRITLFTHALFGFAITQTQGFFDPLLGPQPGETKVDFAMGFGGGVDWNAANWFGLRLVQYDRVPIRVQDEWIHTNRFRTGIVFKWGR